LSRSSTVSQSHLEDIQQAIQAQIEKSTEIKNARFLESQTALIRAEERVKFEREVLDIKEDYERKIRKTREDVFEREKRLDAVF